MNILVVNWRDMKNPDAGGAEVHLHEILKGMVARGHNVTLICSNFEGGGERDSHDGIEVIRKGKWFNANYVIPFAARRYLKENNVDLIVEDVNKIPFFLPAFTNVRVLVVVPHLFGTTVFRETNPLFAMYVFFWEKLIPFVYQSCNFVAISPSTKDDLIARGIPKTKIDVVLCGLDTTTFGLNDGVERYKDPTIVHFGRIRKYKSIDIVIKVLVKLRERIDRVRLLIVGDGPEKPRLEELVKKLGIMDSVEFMGAVPRDKLVEVLNRSHLFINASSKEGWGLTVVEANACGLPVLASNRPGLKDSLRDGVTGYLVEYGDADAFAEKAYQLLSNEELWYRMSKSAVEEARKLTWGKTVEEMEEIFLREASS